MRSYPGRWAAFPTMNPAHGGVISGAGLAAPYRPRGSFETDVRGGILHARYVGTEAGR